jgi:CelD/BcsL family acetyltransferase involved in cellulose biosynthesis
MREVALIRDPERLAALGEDWDGLLAGSAADTVFLTWDWLWSWWQVYGPGAEPCVATVREDGRLVAAAPCKIEERRRYGLSFRQLEFIGTGQAPCPDFLDVVVARGREADLVPLLMETLAAQRTWDKLALTDVLPGSPTWVPLGDALARLGLAPRSEPHCVCPYLPLPASWGEVEASLTHNFRRNHRKKRRRLGWTLTAWQPGDDVGAALASLGQLHQERMESSGRGGHFRKPDYRRFHERFAECAARRGWLYLAFLERDGRAIAGRYGFVYGGTYYAYQSGFDPAAADDSPGEVLLGMVIENLIGRGVREFNFLRGAQPHKLRWARHRRETMRIEAWARTARSRALALVDRVAAERRRLRRRFPALFGPATAGVARPAARASA